MTDGAVVTAALSQVVADEANINAAFKKFVKKFTPTIERRAPAAYLTSNGRAIDAVRMRKDKNNIIKVKRDPDGTQEGLARLRGRARTRRPKDEK